MVKTKIVATLGPASSSEPVLRQMMEAGMDIVRLNFSHGAPREHLAKLRVVHRLNRKTRRHLRVLVDLEGPRIRVGRLAGGKPIELKKHQSLWLTQQPLLGQPGIIPFDYRGSLRGVKKGQPIFIDDGNLLLVVEKVAQHRLQACVVIGGLLKERKGINMPHAHLSFPIITDKDKQDAAFAIEHQADFLALSFVRSREDLTAMRRHLKGKLQGLKIIAKIENAEAIVNINGILKEADGIMIARGDMGVSLPIYEVPVFQKQLIKESKAKGKFVITATQMLESMVEHSRPTRAEVSDVANAVLDGTDAVMLSEETAAGAHPVEAVAMMNEILKYTEKMADKI